MGKPSEAFGLFVSCVEGQPVSRFGTKVLIGAERDASVRGKIRYRTKEIVAIPHDEALKYSREYRRAIDDGSLVARTADEWSQQQQQITEVGAPREKLKAWAQSPPSAAKDADHGDHEGRRE